MYLEEGVEKHSCTGDMLTLKPFLKEMEERLSFKFQRIVADAGYESEENLKYLEEQGIEAFINPADYEQRGTKKLAEHIGHRANMPYDSEEDCYLCHLAMYAKKPIITVMNAMTVRTEKNVCRGRIGRNRWNRDTNI